MYRIIVAIASLLSVAAFAPVSRVSHSSSLKMASPFAKEIGAQAPLGFWDPLGLMESSDKETFDLYRKIEVKHGRVAMMAVLGHIVTTAGLRFPGLESSKVGIAGLATVPADVFVQLLLTVGLLEMGYETRQAEIEKVHLDKSKWNDKTIATKKAIELNNGRAAQMGILGLMVHEQINNDPYVLNALLGAPVPFN